jgi:putative tryptophan/tyrosine transport system substrate-binding protein
LLSQSATTKRRIVFFHPGAVAGFQQQLNAFRGSIKELGYAEGRDLSIEVRAGDNRQDRFPKLAAEIVAQRPDLIVTSTSAAIAAFKQATSSIPIVFAASYDPVGQGFVASLQRPGGNITGVLTHIDLSAKLVEVVREALPTVRRLGILVHDLDPAQRLSLKLFEPAALRHQFEPIVVRVTRVEDLERAFKEFAERKTEAIVVENASFQVTSRQDIIKSALDARLPIFSTSNLIAESGGVLGYSTLTEESWRRAATLVHRILRGARPAELPVEQPERFVMVVNRKAARAIGIELSRVTILRADRLID